MESGTPGTELLLAADALLQQHQDTPRNVPVQTILEPLLQAAAFLTQLLTPVDGEVKSGRPGLLFIRMSHGLGPGIDRRDRGVNWRDCRSTLGRRVLGQDRSLGGSRQIDQELGLP
jgi:hypothetical protein